MSPPEGQRSLVVTDEMRQAVRAEQCSFHGHSYDAIVAGTGEPVRFVCSQCGGSWSVVPREEPAGYGLQPVPNQKGHNRMSDSNVEVNVTAVENTTPPEEQAPVEVSDGDTGAAEEKQG